MSIISKEGGEVIQMPGFWETMMKLAVLLAVPVFGLGSGWAIWITSASIQHEREIAVIQEHLRSIKSSQAGLLSRFGQLPNQVAAAVKPHPEE